MRKNQYQGTYYRTNNKAAKLMLETNFDKSMRFDGKIHFYGNVPQLSVSSVLERFMWVKMANIPTNLLSEYAEEGKMVMEYLQMIHEKKMQDLSQIEWFSERIKNMVLSILQTVINNEWKIMAVEKHISNGFWHGYIDMVIRDKWSNYHIVEIKTRGNFDIRVTDLLQILSYSSMSKVQMCDLLIVNRKTFECHHHHVDRKRTRHVLISLNKWLEFLELIKYKL